jgi:solute carrier family 35 protein E1
LRRSPRCSQDRIGGIGNQFALTNVLSLVFLLPLMLLTEAGKWGDFVALCKSSPSFRYNVIASGMAFYL